VNSHLKDPISRSIHESTSAAFSLSSHPVHRRLRRISIDPAALRAFYQLSDRVDVQNLEYVPFMRFVLAESLAACVGEGFGPTLRAGPHSELTCGGERRVAVAFMDLESSWCS